MGHRLAMASALLAILVLFPLAFYVAARSILSARASDPVLADDFNDNAMNPAVWTTYIRGTGPSLDEINHRLLITIPGDSTIDAGEGRFAAGYQSVCQLRGDFDMQIDYALLIWPPRSGIRVGLGLNEFGATQRDDLAPEAYVAHFPNIDGELQMLPTSDTFGKLRTVRTGTTLKGYYYDSARSRWSLIGQTTASSAAADTGFNLTVWGDHSPSGLVEVAIDNFVVNQGQVICPKTPTPTPTAVREPQIYMPFVPVSSAD